MIDNKMSLLRHGSDRVVKYFIRAVIMSPITQNFFCDKDTLLMKIDAMDLHIRDVAL